ncbi:hypothetical protein D9619_010877 [Psilocybe cf. subviscida]|uniref:Uncharacterized protein n=1 Tax=Psilocybe cf. subviscida TaxID=2480587 RepID=A0A8H5B8J8_9AGAR|nr:hypothetical protein D9619_010877 [Psilocybe cf. subviscida]
MLSESNTDPAHGRSQPPTHEQHTVRPIEQSMFYGIQNATIEPGTVIHCANSELQKGVEISVMENGEKLDFKGGIMCINAQDENMRIFEMRQRQIQREIAMLLHASASPMHQAEAAMRQAEEVWSQVEAVWRQAGAVQQDEKEEKEETGRRGALT